MRRELLETVNVDVADLAEMSTDALALRLAEEQRRVVGANFGYCACGAAVSARATRRAVERGQPVVCRRCAKIAAARRRSKSTDPRIYLCAVCRVPLTGLLACTARQAARRGGFTSCGSAACRAELRLRTSRPRELCETCGVPLSSLRSSEFRYRMKKGIATKPYCNEHKPPRGRPAIIGAQRRQP